MPFKNLTWNRYESVFSHNHKQKKCSLPSSGLSSFIPFKNMYESYFTIIVEWHNIENTKAASEFFVGHNSSLWIFKSPIVRVTLVKMAEQGTLKACPSTKQQINLEKLLKSILSELWKLIKSLQKPGKHLLKKKKRLNLGNRTFQCFNFDPIRHFWPGNNFCLEVNGMHTEHVFLLL